MKILVIGAGVIGVAYAFSTPIPEWRGLLTGVAIEHCILVSLLYHL
jgi:hypothetical protein